MDAEARRRLTGVDATRKLLHEIFHHPHSTTGAVGAKNCLVCLGAIVTHTEAAVKAAIEDERQQAAAATRNISNLLPIGYWRVEAALVADRMERHDEFVVILERRIAQCSDLTARLASAALAHEQYQVIIKNDDAERGRLLTERDALKAERDHWKQEYADQMIRPCHVAHHEDQEIEVGRLKAERDRLLTTLRDLLNRYVKPCAPPCEHGNCSVLRDLHGILAAKAGYTPPQ